RPVVRALGEAEVHGLQQCEAEQADGKHEQRDEHLDHAEAGLGPPPRRPMDAVAGHGQVPLATVTCPTTDRERVRTSDCPERQSTASSTNRRASVPASPRVSKRTLCASAPPASPSSTTSMCPLPSTWRRIRSPAPGSPLASESSHTSQPSS